MAASGATRSGILRSAAAGLARACRAAAVAAPRRGCKAQSVPVRSRWRATPSTRRSVTSTGALDGLPRRACFCVHWLLVTQGPAPLRGWFTLERKADGAACLPGRQGQNRNSLGVEVSPLIGVRGAALPVNLAALHEQCVLAGHRGSYGFVQLARDRSDGTQVAVRSVLFVACCSRL